MRIGISATSLLATGSIDRIIECARGAQRDGFAQFWLGEHITGGVDAVTALAMVGIAVPGLELGTAVVPTYPRHPMALASQVLTASDALSGGFTLGIGVSHASMLAELGLELERPARHTREFLSILLPLLERGEVAFDGHMLTCRARTFVRPQRRCHVVIAALGPHMLKIAGELADGTSLSWVGPRTIRDHIGPLLREAADRAGRGAPRIIATVPICVTDEADAVRQAVSKRLAFYGELPSYRDALSREGVREPGDLCVIGGEDHVREVLRAYADAGVTDLAALELPAGSGSAGRTRSVLREIARAGP
ncbi:MAG: TIGR03564 family F420-dependent LLM class oxidoreductase [Pseudomonadales bacterium]|nr:TIGR03564 family F420-dependent LLM class oxidoreductase [Pseudomonadales bacterium]